MSMKDAYSTHGAVSLCGCWITDTGSCDTWGISIKSVFQDLAKSHSSFSM